MAFKDNDTDPADVIDAADNLVTALNDWDAPSAAWAKERDDLTEQMETLLTRLRAI